MINPSLHKNCLYCHKSFIAQCISRINRSKYCSRECRVESQKKIKEIICIKCKCIYKILHTPKKGTFYSSRYCSLKCKNDSKLKTCKNCLKQFIIKKDINAKFCSRICNGINKRIVDPSYIIDIYNKKVIKLEHCWSWNGNKDIDGYGIFSFNKKMIKAHRASWKIHKGEITNGLFVLHKCDNPPCTNPEHLFLGTAKDNVHDMIKKKRQRFGVNKKV